MKILQYIKITVFLLLIPLFILGIEDNTRIPDNEYQNTSPYHNYNYNFDYEYNFNSYLTENHTWTAGRNILLAAIVPDSAQFPYKQFVDGLKLEAKKHRAGLIVYSLNQIEKSVHEVSEEIIRENIDALILYSLENEENLYLDIKNLKLSNIPVITVWGYIDANCVDMVDSFVGIDPKEAGTRLAVWIAADYAKDFDEILIISHEDSDELPEQCEKKLNNLLLKSTIKHITWSDEFQYEFPESGKVMIVCTNPDYVEDIYKFFSTSDFAEIIAFGEKEKISNLKYKGVIRAGMYYSEQASAENAISLAMLTAGGDKCPVRLVTETEIIAND